MAKEEQEKKKSGSMNKFIHPYKARAGRGVRNVLSLALAIFLVWFLISGGINQRKTGENLAQYGMNGGKEISNFFSGLFSNDSPLKVTEDGVYLNDADVPDNGAVPDPGEGTVTTLQPAPSEAP